MNGVEGLTGDVGNDRGLGIDLAFSSKPYISPNLTRHRENWEWTNKVPKDDPNQGWGGSDDKYTEY